VAITFVQCTKLVSASTNSASGTVSATAGNALIACTNGFGLQLLSSVSGGGTWTVNLAGVSVNTMCTGFASCLSATGGSATITVAYQAGGAAVTAFILEFSGVATSSAFEAAGTQTSGTGTTKTSPALTNTGANAVKVAVTSVDSPGSAAFSSTGTGWTLPANGEEDSSANLVAACAYKIVSASQSDTETWTRTGSDNWVSQIATYLQAAGGGAQDTPELYGRPDGLGGQRTMMQLLAQ
jgi:hypothetical protein